jgi:hypothetical protein
VFVEDMLLTDIKNSLILGLLLILSAELKKTLIVVKYLCSLKGKGVGCSVPI